MKRAAVQVVRTGTQIVKAGYEVMYLKSVLTDAVHEPLAATRRVVRRGQFAAEDFRDEMILAIRKGPFRALAMALGAGFGAGLVVALIGRRR